MLVNDVWGVKAPTVSQPAHQHLYDADFALWMDEAVDLLRQGRFEALDLENLIQEVESLGRHDKQELQSRHFCSN
jgi:uncharacterized protein with von Willebrand factor type A (vWA) domain